jgi:O-antigen/teichoic acid export membrane protein
MTASELGLYAVALTVANGPLILVQTIANIAFPKISAEAKLPGKVEVFGRYLRLAVAVVLAVDVVLWALNAWLVPLLFGAAFAPAVAIANLCLVGLVPFAVKLLCAAALKACDRALAIPRAELWGLVAVAPSLVLLVPRFGLLGAAASLVIAQTVTAVLLARRLGREFDIHPLRVMLPTAEDAALLRGLLARGLRRG